MLGRSGETAYIHEPFCPNRSPGWITRPMPYWFMYLDGGNGPEFDGAIERVLRLRYPIVRSLAAARGPKDVARQVPEIFRSLVYRARGARPLLKDPFALFSAEWLADRYSVIPVIMIRKPVAFVASIKRLNWGFDYERNWLPQTALMRDHLARHADSMRGYEGEVDLVGEGIVMWNVLYDFVADLRERRPDLVYLIYEDLAARPLEGFEELYSRLGLRWDDGVRERIAGFSDGSNPKDVSARRRRAIRRDSSAAAETWRQRLGEEEVRRVEEETAEVAARLYPSA